jgi:hypothetical protein
MSQAQRAVIALFVCLVVWLAWQDRTSWRNPQSGNYAEQTAHSSRAIVVTEKSPDKITDWLLVALNFFLVSSTLLLWRASNRSAKIAERALTELEAPVIGVKIIKPGLHWNQLKNSISFGQLQYSFVNLGRTPATLYELFDDVRTVKVKQGYPPDVRAERGAPLPYGVFIPPSGESRIFSFPIFAHMIGIVANEGSEEFKSRIPFFLGTARYGDIFGNLYTMGFCFMFDDVGNNFLEAGGPDYSYCHKERGTYRAPGST